MHKTVYNLSLIFFPIDFYRVMKSRIKSGIFLFNKIINSHELIKSHGSEIMSNRFQEILRANQDKRSPVTFAQNKILMQYMDRNKTEKNTGN